MGRLEEQINKNLEDQKAKSSDLDKCDSKEKEAVEKELINLKRKEKEFDQDRMEARMKIKMLDAEIETTKRAHAQWIDMREQQRQHMQREQQTYLRAQSGYRAVQEQIDSAKAAMAKFEEGSVPLEAVWEVDTDDVSDFKPFKRAYVFQKQENTESTSSTSSSSGANAGVSCFFVKGNIEAAKERAG